MRKVWSRAEERIVRRRYPHERTEDLAAELGCSARQLYTKSDKLGVKKSPEFMASERSGRILPGKTKPGSVATQFRPGQESWNKGTKGVTGNHPNSQRTQFKAGRAPHEARNYRPIGSLRITVDGYL